MKGEGDAFEEAPTLAPGQWQVHPPTGMVTVTEEAFARLLNPEPIENLYILDPEPIARGQFAVVYHCTHRATGQEFAAKFSSRSRMGTDCTADLVHEIAVSAMLKPTTKAVHLVDVFSTEAELILVMEYATGGDLQTLLDEKLVPYERDVIKFMRQLLEGLVFIHDRNIVHLDIKPPNLVLMGEFPDCAVKLCDFEISRVLTPGQEVCEFLGTPDYVAPEILHYEPITTRTDMWSVGVLTYVLLTGGFLPFGGETVQETYVEILKCEVDFPSELFEDITPEAIDFIKKLLLRHPEQRMTAKESLNHVWIKKGCRCEPQTPNRPTPPSTLNLTNPLSLQMTPTLPVNVVRTDSCPNESLSENTITSTHPILTKSPSENTKLQDLTTPSRDIGRPPLHPASSQRSLFGDSSSVAGTPVTTPGSALMSPFIYRQESRFGSRQNLDRLRSMSKSREVIFERVQKSNLKKSLSKSRERLSEAKLGMSKSREQLLALSSLSQSVEALSAFSRLTQQNNLYQSCNNIFVPKIQLPHVSGNSQGRMYQSMAGIDQIDKMNYPQKAAYFESTISLKDEDYNDVLTQRNTNMNCFVGDPNFDKAIENKNTLGLRGNTCKGGRGGDTCDNRCTRHRQAEAKLTQKIQKVSKAEKMKKGAQRRRKEKKEKEIQERLKREKERKEKEKQKAQNLMEGESLKSKSSENPSSPSFRRGSVSHVEQRIQERHERIQERLEKQEREEKKSRRRISVDNDHRGNSAEKSKSRSSSSLGVTSQRPRSTTPTRKRSKNEPCPSEGEISQASSTESVNVVSEEKCFFDLEDKETVCLDFKNEQVDEDEKNNNTLNSKTDEDVEADEAYISLEDTNREVFLSRSKSTESTSSSESDKTVIENKEEEGRLSSDDEPGLETLTVTEKIFGFEKGLIGTIKKAPLIKQRSFTEFLDKNDMEMKELPIISEESPSPDSSSPPPFQRSISNTSDLGSLISESSDGSVEKETSSVSSESHGDFLSPDWKVRSRSYSVYSNPSPPLSSPRSRSNSFNFDIPDTNGARPWGNVCSGSVARAFEKFNLKPSENTKKLSTPISPCQEKAPSQLR